MANLEEKKKKAGAILRRLKKLFPVPDSALHYSNNHELLFAVMLSAQTTDKKVNEVTEKLFKKYRTIDDYARTKPSLFAEEIRQVNFYRTKARHIIETAKILNSEYGGEVPLTMGKLTRLPGVGRKSANVVITHADGEVTGIAVDTHVKRLARLFGLTKEKEPDNIEQNLMKLYPKKDWHGINPRLVYYGRAYCTARCKHLECPLRNYIEGIQ
ncbi:MAG: endonuclease III [Candidatus Vogelbacteria bacterium]|nr:endonuclease III [Candidatus Vogelbacteria bacterium]